MVAYNYGLLFSSLLQEKGALQELTHQHPLLTHEKGGLQELTHQHPLLTHRKTFNQRCRDLSGTVMTCSRGAGMDDIQIYVMFEEDCVNTDHQRQPIDVEELSLLP